MIPVRDEIQNWITEVITEVTEQGSAAFVSLLHFDGHGRENELLSMKVGSAKWGNADTMAETFHRYAERHARGLPGSQQFKLHAGFGTSSSATRFLPFGMAGALSFGALPGGGLASEAPTPTGQISQGMRMGEIVVQGMIGQINPTFRVQSDLIGRLMAYLKDAESDKRELWIACKSLLLELQKEKHADKMRELMAARMTEFGKHIITLAPAIINMMADREVFPLSVADTATLDFIASVSNPTDIATMQAALMAKGEGGKEIAVVLTERFNKYHQRKGEEAAADRRLMDGLPSRSYDEAEQDAAGDAIRALRGKSSNGAANGASGTEAAVKALTNGNGNGTKASPPQVPAKEDPPKAPREGFNDAEHFLADLFQTVAPEKINLVINMLGVEQPELAGKMRQMLALFRS